MRDRDYKWEDYGPEDTLEQSQAEAAFHRQYGAVERERCEMSGEPIAGRAYQLNWCDIHGKNFKRGEQCPLCEQAAFERGRQIKAGHVTRIIAELNDTWKELEHVGFTLLAAKVSTLAKELSNMIARSLAQPAASGPQPPVILQGMPKQNCPAPSSDFHKDADMVWPLPASAGSREGQQRLLAIGHCPWDTEVEEGDHLPEPHCHAGKDGDCSFAYCPQPLLKRPTESPLAGLVAKWEAEVKRLQDLSEQLANNGEQHRSDICIARAGEISSCAVQAKAALAAAGGTGR